MGYNSINVIANCNLVSIYNLQEMMRNEVFELANQVSNFKDVYNRYPWEHVADCLSQHWNFVNFTEHKCPKCKNQLISMVYQTNNGHYDKPEVLYICTSCQSQYDSDIKILQNSHLIDQEYIKKSTLLPLN